MCGCFSLGVALVCRGVNLLQRLMTERSNTQGSGVDVRMAGYADGWMCGCFSLGVALVCRRVNLVQRLMTERSNTQRSGG